MSSDVGHPAQTKARQLIDHCVEAYAACRLATAYGANKGGDLAEPHLLQHLHDAADICLALANFLSRGSRHHRPLARLTAEVTAATADALGGFNDDPLTDARAACQAVHDACHALAEK